MNYDNFSNDSLEKLLVKSSDVHVANFQKQKEYGEMFLLFNQQLSISWEVPHIPHSSLENRLVLIEEKL